MTTTARIFVATCSGLITAGVVAVCSYRLGTPHIIPGCLIGFGLNGVNTYIFIGRYAAARGSK